MATVLLLAVIGVVAGAGPASADTVTVPYVDRLGCGGSSDALVTPLFGYNGTGTAANGGGYTATTSASAYPATTGSFSAVSPGTGYTVYSPIGYGSDFVYRATNALGFPNVSPGRAATLTLTLPHPQVVQFTVGGIDVPSQLTARATGPGGAVTPSAAVRGGTPGSATVTTLPGAVRVNGSTIGGADGQPAKAVDIWVTQPVTSLSLSLSTGGGGVDSGFLVTPPVACQSAAVGTDATVGTPAVDAAAGRVSYPVTLITTVTNSSPATGAFLHPSVTAPLAAALAGQGFSLDAVAFAAASDPACAPEAGADGSGALIGSGPASLAPAATCTLSWSATVSAPQSSADRSIAFPSTLSSSGVAAAARVKSTTSTTLTFPGLTSQLALTESGATQAEPGQTVTHTTTATNTGAGAALGTVVAIDTGGVTPTGFPGGCSYAAPTLTCDLGAIAPQASASVSYSIVVPAGAANGDAFTFAATASSSAQSVSATSTYTLSTVVPPPPPTPNPTPRPQPTRRPVPSPSAPAPAPTPTITQPPVTPPVVVTPPAPVPEQAGALPMQLRFGAAQLMPGTVTAMRGSIGPNSSAEAVTITLTGRMTQGMIYRSVRALIGDADAGECSVQPREFSCVITLQPGESSTLEVRVFADALNAPATAIQQLAVASSDPSQNNAATVTTAVNQQRDTDAWAAAFVLDFNSFPAAFVPLLALFLYALAASVARSSRGRSDTDPPSDGA